MTSVSIQRSVLFCRILFLVYFLSLTFVHAAPAGSDQFGIQSVNVNGKALYPSKTGKLNLGLSPRSISFGFGPVPKDAHPPLRLRGKLEGFDSDWHEGGAYMAMDVRFINEAGDQIEQKEFRVAGESAGWKGSLKTSPLTHRRETLIAPPEASRVWIVISSAGPPAAVGIYVVANLTLSKTSDDLPAKILMQPFMEQSKPLASDPPGWTRDGTHTSMAKILDIGEKPTIRALAIEDDDLNAHAEWRNTKDSAPEIHPGDRLVVEWNEMYSIGAADFRSILYTTLPPQTYRFRVQGMGLMGTSDIAETSIAVYVPRPLWERSWFWGVTSFAILMMLLGALRYVSWQRMQKEVRQLKAQQALESERLRIARDIHDDLGARVTQISMVSATALLDPALSEKTRAELDQIKRESRELITALYETVWTVNPDYDDLDSLANYLCQMANHMCKQTPFRCRLQVAELPKDVKVSSQIRHNIAMVFKESLHNVIKHSGGSEVTLRLVFENNTLDIAVQDDGRGFDPGAQATGNGLSNMRQRMAELGGDFSIKSEPGKGTIARLRLPIKRTMDSA
jgi:signal transduction histidine kinase